MVRCPSLGSLLARGALVEVGAASLDPRLCLAGQVLDQLAVTQAGGGERCGLRFGEAPQPCDGFSGDAEGHSRFAQYEDEGGILGVGRRRRASSWSGATWNVRWDGTKARRWDVHRAGAAEAHRVPGVDEGDVAAARLAPEASGWPVSASRTGLPLATLDGGDEYPGRVVGSGEEAALAVEVPAAFGLGGERRRWVGGPGHGSGTGAEDGVDAVSGEDA